MPKSPSLLVSAFVASTLIGLFPKYDDIEPKLPRFNHITSSKPTKRRHKVKLARKANLKRINNHK